LGKREQATATHLCAEERSEVNEKMTLPEYHALNSKNQNVACKENAFK
jgi:hypothetical protein